MLAPRPLALLLVASQAAAARASEPPPPEPAAEGSPLAPEPAPRRSVELSLQAGAAALRCGGSAPTSAQRLDPCASLRSPTGAGASLLWRLDGRWAIGVAGARDRVAWGGDAPGEGSWSQLGLEARWYPRVEGPWEPLIGSRIGVGWLAMTRGEETLRREGLAAAAQAGVGRWLGSRLRLSLALEARWQAGGEAERCAAGACLRSDVARLPDRSLGLIAAVTLAAGDEL